MLERESQIEGKRFPATRVKHTIVWKNPEVAYPFNLQDKEENGISPDQPSKLGLFLTNNVTAENSRPTIQLAVDPIHHRRSSLGEMEISDKQNNIYHDVDLKGTGYVSRARGGGPIRIFHPRRRGEHDTWGTWRRDKAERERDISEHLTKQGLRTSRFIAVLRLQEIALPNGQILSIEKAKEAGFLQPTEEPVIGVRASRAKDRIRRHWPQQPNSLKKTKETIEKETKRKMSWEDYLGWFADTVGKNLALIHNCGYWHGWVSPHNVTLAAEIMDFGFGEDSKKLNDLPYVSQQQHKQKDLVVARDTLNTLTQKLVEFNYIPASRKTLLQTPRRFEGAYKKTLE